MSSKTVQEQRVAGRRRRRDFGSVRLSERDRRLLFLIAEQYAISVDQLASLIGRSYRTGRWLRDRWHQAGWVSSRQLVSGGRSFIWLSREGARVAQTPYRNWQPNPGLAGHIEAVTEVRLLLERQLKLGAWLCERSLAKSYPLRSGMRPHLPDAVLQSDAGRVAIEVELTLKSRTRLDAIMAELGQRYERVWYFAAAPLVATLSGLAAESRWQNIEVYNYPPRATELRPL